MQLKRWFQPVYMFQSLRQRLFHSSIPRGIYYSIINIFILQYKTVLTSK